MKEESLDLIYEEEEYTDVDVEFELTLLARSVQMLSERLRRSVHIDGTFHTFRSEATTDVYVFVDSEMMEQNHVDRYHKNYKPFANRRYEADLDSLKGIMDECRTLDKYNIEKAK